jgi:hypothetical protein
LCKSVDGMLIGCLSEVTWVKRPDGWQLPTRVKPLYNSLVLKLLSHAQTRLGAQKSIVTQQLGDTTLNHLPGHTPMSVSCQVQARTYIRTSRIDTSSKP